MKYKTTIFASDSLLNLIILSKGGFIILYINTQKRLYRDDIAAFFMPINRRKSNIPM